MKVSVVCPTYNRPEMICELIESFLEQGYVEKELIIVDGSIIDYENKIKKYSGNIKYFKLPQTQGQGYSARAINYGIENSDGELLTLLSDDDLFDGRNSLSIRIKEFINDPELDWVYTGATDFTGNKRHIIRSTSKPAEEPDIKRLLYTDYISMLTIMWRRRVNDKIGLFPVDVPGNEDWEWKIKALMECKVKKLDVFTILFRRHPDNSSMKFRDLTLSSGKIVYDRMMEKYKCQLQAL